jgi:hypothetical protein
MEVIGMLFFQKKTEKINIINVLYYLLRNASQPHKYSKVEEI